MQLVRGPVLVGAIVLSLLLVAGFSGWLVQGSTLLLAMAESGLSWCF